MGSLISVEMSKVLPSRVTRKWLEEDCRIDDCFARRVVAELHKLPSFSHKQIPSDEMLIGAFNRAGMNDGMARDYARLIRQANIGGLSLSERVRRAYYFRFPLLGPLVWLAVRYWDWGLILGVLVVACYLFLHAVDVI